ncbi:MAG: DCC1-like thiol-disulfide oxidoreductase family protein [Cyanobacteria bacterium P01_D01_bin.156]
MIAAWLKFLERFLGFDLRSIALLRLGLAFLLLVELFSHWGNARPISQALSNTGWNSWSLHGLSNGGVWQLGCFAIATLATLLMLIGYRTRWATITSWVLLISLHNYHSEATSQADTMLQAILFWALFLPLGSRYSVDQALNTSPRPQPQKLLTGANLGIVLQLGLMVMALSQAGSLHSWIILGVTSLVLIPSFVWNHWTATAFTPKQLGLKIYYDADCGFCKKVVHLLRTFLVLPRRVPLQTAQSDPVIHTAMETHNSWVIVDWRGQHHYKWQGIAYVVSLSPIVWPLASLLRWSPLMTVGTRFYETIANNRRFAGNFTKPFKFQTFSIQSSGSLNLIALVIVILTVGAYAHHVTGHTGAGQHPVIALIHWATTPTQWLSPLLQPVWIGLET